MPFISSVRGSYGAQGRFGRTLAANFFGSGADGAAVISSNTNLTVLNKIGSYDGDMVVRQYSSLTINSGATLTTDQPCRGLLIYVDGDCTINGTLSMDGRGAYANPTVSGASDANAVSANGLQIPFITSTGNQTLSASATLFNGCGTTARTVIANQKSISGNGTILTLVRQGADGGSGGGSGSGWKPGASGSNGSTGQSGGGGGGRGSYADPSGGGGTGGAGSYGSCFAGGSGGGDGQYSGQSGSSATAWAGPGGNAAATNGYGAGGGIGNPSGSNAGGGAAPTTQPNGTGGLLILIVKGNITLGTNGRIVARGLAGAEENGGSSGGGNIIVAYGGDLNNRYTTLNLSSRNYAYGSTTMTTSSNHDLIVGDELAISATSNAGYNGTYRTVQIPAANQFRYRNSLGSTSPGGDSGSTSGTAILNRISAIGGHNKDQWNSVQSTVISGMAGGYGSVQTLKVS
jgi:hypothetical protein